MTTLSPRLNLPALDPPANIDPVLHRDLRLPDDVQIHEAVGRGHRAQVYRASYEGRPVALKVYDSSIAERTRQRHGKSIAEFEFERNTAFYRHPDLRQYVAEPIAVFKSTDGWSEAFAQELLIVPSVRRFFEMHQTLPPGFLEKVRRICQLAKDANLSDLDLSASNILVRNSKQGFVPVLFDFNMIPRHERTTNPVVSLLYGLKIRMPDYRDRRQLRKLHECYSGS